MDRGIVSSDVFGSARNVSISLAALAEWDGLHASQPTPDSDEKRKTDGF